MRSKASLILLVVLVMLILAAGVPAAQEKPAAAPAAPAAAAKQAESVPLDEVTMLKIQNAQLQLQLIQQQTEKALQNFMANRKLKPEEWTIDTQRMVLVKKDPGKTGKD